MTSFSLLMIIGGLIHAKKTLDNKQHIDTVLQTFGNCAGKVAYFDITETPAFLSKESSNSNYYLLTDGKEYRVGEMDEDEYKEIKSDVETTGSYRILGITHYIADQKSRREVASEVGQLLGQKLTDENMDDVLGEVCIEYMKISFFNVFKNSLGFVGIILGPIAIFIILGGSYEMRV